MTVDQALAGARDMREVAARMARIVADARQPFGLRYGAAVLKEEAEETAARYDRIAVSTDRRCK